MRALLERAVAGERQVAFITGEPGCGKTSLIRGFAAIVREQGADFAAGHCFERLGTGEAFAPVFEAIGTLCDDERGRKVPEILARFAPTWRQQLPWLEPSEGPREGLRPGSTDGTERMYREACEFLEALTRETPLVLVLEDMHWSDHATVELLSAVAHRGRPARLLVIATYRSAEVQHTGHPIFTLKRDLVPRRIGTEIAVAGLDERAVGRFLERRCPGAVFPDHLPNWLRSRTAGNPLFLANLLDDWEDRGIVRQNGGQWELGVQNPGSEPSVPKMVRELVEGRIARLSLEERRVLEAFSVAGSEIRTSVVALALDLPEIEVEACAERLARREQILDANDELPRRDPGQSSDYCFHHEIYRDVVYQGIPRALRASLHLQFGRALEAQPGGAASAQAAQLALHFEQGRDFPRAVTYHDKAAANVAHRFAYREALQYLDRAFALAEFLSGPERTTARLRLFERRGLIRRASNDLKGANGDFVALADCARDCGLHDLELTAHDYRASINSWVDRDSCLAASDAALALVPKIVDGRRQADARGRSAYWNLLWRDWNNGDAAAIATAVDVARTAGDRSNFAHHAVRHCLILAMTSNYEAACQLGDEFSSLDLQTNEAAEFLLGQFSRAWALLHAGRWGEMSAVVEQGLAVASNCGHRRWALLLSLEQAWLFEQAFDFPSAVAVADGALREARELNLGFGELFALVARGSALFGMGKTDDALTDFRSAQSLLNAGPRLLGWCWRLPVELGLGECFLRRRELDEARQAATRLRAYAAEPGERTYLAHASRLIVELSALEGKSLELTQALSAMESAAGEGLIPLARWRIDATLARIGRGLRDRRAEQGGLGALGQLARSLGEGHPLAPGFVSRAVASAGGNGLVQ